MLRNLIAKAVLLAFVTAAAAGLSGCASDTPPPSRSALSALRARGVASNDADQVGRWLLAELISQGGDPERAKQARKKVDALDGESMVASLGRGLDDSMHGRLASASEHYLRAVRAARSSADDRAPLVAWFAAHRAISLGSHDPDLWQRWSSFVQAAIDDPQQLGWRARGELIDWAANEAWFEAEADVEERAARQFGCVDQARLSGPFGRGALSDSYRSFAAERPGRWPQHFPRERGASHRPRLHPIETEGCAITTKDPVEPGIYYAETFFELSEPAEVLLAVQGALHIRINDYPVLKRDIRDWGVWPRFGVKVRLPAGRHRVVARLGEPRTSIRLMRPDGRPFPVKASDDPAPPYTLLAPEITGEANLLMQYVRDGDIVDPDDDLTRFIAAYLFHVESSNDVASVMMEPLIDDVEQAAGPSLTMASLYAKNDPIFDATQTRDLVRQLHERALERDPGLWAPAVGLAISEAASKGTAEVVPRLEKLFEKFDGVAAVGLTLATAYGELGWSVEHARIVQELTERFPENLDVLYAAVDVYDAEGKTAQAEALVDRIKKLDPDSEIVLSRALARKDYDRALEELRRLAKRRPDREDIATRIYDVMVRAGNRNETWKKLAAAVEEEPKSGQARLDLADFKYAKGDHAALRSALVDAIEKGADTEPLSTALDLVEGTTALEPYRLDALPIIEEYDASGRELPGTAARVLDYAALWVRSDGSSQMLEHEVIKIQSAEGIEQFAEHRRLEGLVLHMRVIKQDGRTLEPEPVPGKPTVTFPHLEVGDYIETEQVVRLTDSGSRARYLGPRWYFREENVAYARSEFVVITPQSRDLVIETVGAAPEPEITRDDGIVVRRYKVIDSPAAPEEPNSPPPSDYLPSVRVGWGVNLQTHLDSLADAVAEVTPADPRIRTIAERIVEPLPESAEIERASRLYHWVLDNVEKGEENDGRRVIIGKNGNRWRGFITLCRALDIDVTYAVAKSRLAAPPPGPITRASQFTEPALRLSTSEGTRWVTLTGEFSPFGYVPDAIRGMPAYLLGSRPYQRTQVPAEGRLDAVAFEGKGTLAADGSLEMTLVERFSGNLAMSLRHGLSQVPERRMRDALESNLLARALHGARLEEYSLEHRDDPDEPLLVRLDVEVPRFAQRGPTGLMVSPPFSMDLSRAAALPERQTPLLIRAPIHRRIQLELELPKGASVRAMKNQVIENGERRVVIQDRSTENQLVLDRTIAIPAGRVAPEDYPDFVRFARQADAALSSAIRIRVPREAEE